MEATISATATIVKVAWIMQFFTIAGIILTPLALVIIGYLIGHQKGFKQGLKVKS